MSVALDENMSGLADADARLAALESAELTAQKASGAGAVPTDQAKPDAGKPAAADPAAAPGKQEAQTPAKSSTDTPAAADGKSAPNSDTKDNTPAAKPEAGKTDAKSNYTKSQERLERTWDNVNKRKGDLDTREQQLTQREQQLQQREAQFKDQAERAQQPQHKPEDFERAAQLKLQRAQSLHQQADGIEARAKKLEDDGKYTEAAKAQEEAKGIRKKAYQEEGNAEDLKAHAGELRKNPPPTQAQRDQQLETQRKEWTTKAAAEFPDLAKKGSELQTRVAKSLNELWNTDRVLASHPQIIYYVTKLEAAQTAAARVPAMEKELGELKAKVKEYEALTAPGGEGAAQRPAAGDQARTDAEERAELGQMAEQVGTIR